MLILRSLLLLTVCVWLADGENILFFLALSSYSHRIAMWPYAEKLAERGHHVTFIQSFKPKKPNPKIKEFFPKQLESFGEEFEQMNLLGIRLEKGREGITALNKVLPKMGLDICEGFLSDPETSDWIKNSKFDLIVVDALMNDCAFGFAHIFKAKTIIYGTSHPIAWWADTFGIQIEAASIDDFFMPFNHPMKWYEKLTTSLFPFYVYWDKQSSFHPQMTEIFRKHFNDPNFPSISDLERNTSLLFSGSHFSEEHSRSLPPLVVPVGGMHCDDSSQKLTPELEAFINGSGDTGFIYISFGSAAKISIAPKYFQDIFYTALKNSKARFVWKYEADRPADMPSNVFTGKWLPQQAILAHPKIKAFLTHGGLLGMQEAVWHAVPLLPIPVFAEQDYNALRVDRTERGILLDPNTLTVEKLESAIHKVTTDPKYKKNMESASRLFKDRPAKPVDTAVWWTEFVLRHTEEDLKALKPLGMKQNWYQRRLLDVWAIVFSILTTAIVLVIFIAKKILKLFSGGSGKSKVKTN